MIPERIDEIGDEIFFFGAGFDDFFFVFDDDFVVGNFDNLSFGDGELGVDEALDNGALDDDLLDVKIVRIDGKIDDFAEFTMFLGFYFEADRVKIEF